MKHFIALSILIVFQCWFSFMNYNRGYRDGQIDALNSKVRYELITNDDSTTTWKRIKKDSREKYRVIIFPIGF